MCSRGGSATWLGPPGWPALPANRTVSACRGAAPTYSLNHLTLASTAQEQQMQQKVIPADAAGYMAALQSLQVGCSAGRHQPQPEQHWLYMPGRLPVQRPLNRAGCAHVQHVAGFAACMKQGRALGQVLGGRRGRLVLVRGPSIAAPSWLKLQCVCNKAGACFKAGIRQTCLGSCSCEERICAAAPFPAGSTGVHHLQQA